MTTMDNLSLQKINLLLMHSTQKISHQQLPLTKCPRLAIAKEIKTLYPYSKPSKAQTMPSAPSKMVAVSKITFAIKIVEAVRKIIIYNIFVSYTK